MRVLQGLCCLFLLCGFSLSAHAAGDGLVLQHVVQGELTRDYYIYDPRTAAAQDSAAKRPLIIVLHGGGGTAEKFSSFMGEQVSFSKLAVREDVLVVYPQGVDKHWNDGRAVEHIKAHATQVDDVGFISTIIDTMVKTKNVDPARVYVTGPSNGGFMSNRLACDLSSKIAAVGIVIAAMQVNVQPVCKPEKPVSVLIMNGTQDPLVPFDGGHVRLVKKGKSRGEILSTADTFDFWLHHAGYRGKGAALPKTALPDADPKDKTRVYMQSFAGETSEVVLYTIEGGGHTWPGARDTVLRRLVGATSQDINATGVIWDFFKNKRRD